MTLVLGVLVSLSACGARSGLEVGDRNTTDAPDGGGMGGGGMGGGAEGGGGGIIQPSCTLQLDGPPRQVLLPENSELYSPRFAGTDSQGRVVIAGAAEGIDAQHLAQARINAWGEWPEEDSALGWAELSQAVDINLPAAPTAATLGANDETIIAYSSGSIATGFGALRVASFDAPEDGQLIDPAAWPTSLIAAPNGNGFWLGYSSHQSAEAQSYSSHAVFIQPLNSGQPQQLGCGQQTATLVDDVLGSEVQVLGMANGSTLLAASTHGDSCLTPQQPIKPTAALEIFRSDTPDSLTQTDFADCSPAGRVALVPRPSGGAWLVRAGKYNVGVNYETGGCIARVDDNGTIQSLQPFTETPFFTWDPPAMGSIAGRLVSVWSRPGIFWIQLHDADDQPGQIFSIPFTGGLGGYVDTLTSADNNSMLITWWETYSNILKVARLSCVPDDVDP